MKEGLRRARLSDAHELGAWVSQTLGILFQTEDHRRACARSSRSARRLPGR